jgi:hypothetical protein
MAAVLGVFGFVALVAYATVGVGGAVAQAADTQEISAKALTNHGCNDTEWHFVITEVDSEADAPATIHVTWANGDSADVPLADFTGKVAHYTTMANLDSTVTSATAEIYAGWSGEFNLSHGPCGPPPSSSPPPSTTKPPPSTTTPPPSTTTPPPSTTTPPPSTTTPPPSTSSAPVVSSSVPASASSPTSAAAVVATSSPFVPGPGQTGDTGPDGGSTLKKILLGVALAFLTSAAVLAVQPLRRRGNHA